ncbi:MAG: hypothetical protein ACLQFR_12020 [Streptosporangiaceae bacterium]
MRKNVARAAGLMGLAAGLIALAGSAAAPALAGTTDTGGTATIAIRHYTLAGVAKAGIVILPGEPGTASYASGHEVISTPVTGGDANFIGTAGTLDLAGTIQFTDGVTGRSVTLTNLTFSYGTAYISGVAGSTRLVLGAVGGAENGQTSAGPPATQTFTASGVYTTIGGARYLDEALHTGYFKAGQDLGRFATTYDVATS